MATGTKWQDEYWLLAMQAYLRKPAGVKPLYHRDMVELSMELHIPPQTLHAKMEQIARLDTPRIERIWNAYADNPRRLAHAVNLWRSMTGFGDAQAFYDGVDASETFEKDFRPIDGDGRWTPVMLTLVLNVYFQLTPATMVAETPEVIQLARLLKVTPQDIVAALETFQQSDPYLNRKGDTHTPLAAACRQTWQRYAQTEPEQLDRHASALKVYFET